MDFPAFTARNVAKFVTKSAVAAYATDLAADAMVDYTSLDEDSATVSIGSKVIGWYISQKLEPVSDAGVDVVANFIVAKREKRQAKKNTEEK